jgi:HEAT repeat protein
MLFIILLIVIVSALVYAFSSNRALNRNERLYLKRRGYEPPPTEIDEGPPVPRDALLFSLIESLGDISTYARQRAAEDLSRMCASGKRDSRMLSPLIAALDDSEPAVRGAVALALGNLGDPASVDALHRRIETEESIYVRASLEQALEKLGVKRQKSFKIT